MNLQEEIEKFDKLAKLLRDTKDLGERQEILLDQPRVQHALQSGYLNAFLTACRDLSSKNALFSLSAIDQHVHVLTYPKYPPRQKIRQMLIQLVQIDKFYESIGGIVGYQRLVLKLLCKNTPYYPLSFSRASALDIQDASQSFEVMLEGLKALPEMGEMYPMGGLGTRLNLTSKKGESLPVAMLPFLGRTLLEGLIRDLQAREFLYSRLYGKQITVPVALMTSKENQNDARIHSLCEKKKWFERPKESFFLFSQISVPVIAENGKWTLKGPLQLNLQPGGHGALWKAAEEKGVFLWFLNQEKHRLLIRQINNPLAGVDHGLLSLIGAGKKENKCFGFASCERLKTAAEGILVLVEEEGTRRISNIEYTDFKKYEIERTLDEKPSFANTNILYADLKHLLPSIKNNPLPGLILNMKSQVEFRNKEGKVISLRGGRLESMMQNISDALKTKSSNLPTFLTFNKRSKTISAAKKSFENDLLETPEGAFYDILKNSYELLVKECHFHLPPFPSHEEYLKKGPSFVFLYHPALGPLYSLLSQKIQQGEMSYGSELQLEIADLQIHQLNLGGSLLIEAKNLLGPSLQGIVRYGHKTGKCILKNVSVKNKGMNRENIGAIWKNSIQREESCKIVLLGNSEFYAENVSFEGNQTLIIPDNERWVALPDKNGQIIYCKEHTGWEFTYKKENRSIVLDIKNASCLENISHKAFLQERQTQQV